MPDYLQGDQPPGGPLGGIFSSLHPPPRSEPYIGSWPRPPRQWGQPDHILQSARSMSGPLPGPFMPQQGDVRSLLSTALGQNGGLSQIGSPLIRQLAMGSMRINAAWIKDFIAGRETAMKLLDQQQKRHLDEIVLKQQQESERYGIIMGYFKDPAERNRQLRAAAVELGDTQGPLSMIAALDSGDATAPERLVAERDKHWLSLAKYRTQNEKIEAGERARAAESSPMPEEPDTTPAVPAKPPEAPLVDPSVAPSSDGAEPPPELLTPDEPETAPAGQQQGSAAPQQQTPAATAQQNPEEAPPYQVAGPATAPPTQPLENMPEVAQATPMPRDIISGVPVQQAPGQLRVNPPPPAPRVPASTYDGRTGNWSETSAVLPPARLTAPGFSSQRLDILARYRLGTQADLFKTDDPLHVERNEAVNRRAVQMEVAINHILDAPGLTPDEKMRAISQIHPGMAAQAREIIAGGEALPRATNNRYNQLLAQVVPRVDPSFSQQRFPQLQKIYGDYTPGGYAGRNIQSANRLAQAAAEVVKAARALPDGPIPVNRWNEFIAGHFTGAPAYRNFFIAWRDYSMEQVRLARGGQGAEGDIRANIEAVPPSASKPTIFQTLKIQTRVATSSIRGFRNYWRQMVPGNKPMPGEDPEVNAVFDAINRMNPETGELADQPPEMRPEPIPPSVRVRRID
jgi:hypothetical protein